MAAALPPGWTAHQDAEGRVFYANAAGESSWTLPEAQAEAQADSDADSDDEVDEVPMHLRMADSGATRSRSSVSAEAYGQWNPKSPFFAAPRYEKTQEQMERLSSTLYRSFLFQGLEKTDMDTLLLAMREECFEVGHWVFNEGDDGDFLFVVEYGTLDCIKNLGGEATLVKQCAMGDVFGELALLYNCPRAAGVQAREMCVCWKLDRETFNHVVRDAAEKRRDLYDVFLKSVPLLQTLSSQERAHVADALVPNCYRQGDLLIRQGDPGDSFYIVEQGQLHAFKDGEPVMAYNPGDFFGELALLTNQPRAASVTVASETCKVLIMSRACFTKMLGPLDHLLERSYV